MPAVSTARIRKHIQQFDFVSLFIEEIGWDQLRETHTIIADGQTYILTPVAEKRTFKVFSCSPGPDGRIPERSVRIKIDREITKVAREHLLVFIDTDRTRQQWTWVRRERGRPVAMREHVWALGLSGHLLADKLAMLAVTIAEEENITLTDIGRRAKGAWDTETVTKRFYDRFEMEHAAFLKLLQGIPEEGLARWYVSVLLNRLMFIYFLQRQGFMEGDRHYLRRLLEKSRSVGPDRFYRDYLCPLFFNGFAEKTKSVSFIATFGDVPYLNGGIFEKHEIELGYKGRITISDKAFDAIFEFFDAFDWYLDTRQSTHRVPQIGEEPRPEINPDVLGYIFEKYINNKQMGAYYTKEDITGYITRNTIIPRLLDMAREKCRIAFEPQGTVWKLLRENPDAYIHSAIRHGVTLDIHNDIPLARPYVLPQEIADGIHDVTQRGGWNHLAPPEYALSTEIWREVIARREHYDKVHAKLAVGDVHAANDLVTLNLDIEQFVQDMIRTCEGPDLLRAVWRAIAGHTARRSNEQNEDGISVLDPTCGSGAFLFAALNILEPLYEACLDRMELFIEEGNIAAAASMRRKGGAEQYADFKMILKDVARHPNRRYYIYKAIIVGNLFGVDIMPEAVEICKLRLFLKLAGQLEEGQPLEPLPDIDFNIRAGNTLVGYATEQEVRTAITEAEAGQLRAVFDADAETLMSIERKAEEIRNAFDLFRRLQAEGEDSEVFAQSSREAKLELRAKIASLEEGLNQYLARQYGVKMKRDGTLGTKEYADWKKSYQPFHWFIEFYGILADGGFDVIIGNPPYLEYSKVHSYTIHGYATEVCSDLYAFTVERSLSLVSKNGFVGMIVPISVACSDMFGALRNCLFGTSRSLWLSHFANRPGQLFAGAQNRLTIFVASGRQTYPNFFSTRYCRWDAKNGERENLFPTLYFYQLTAEMSMFHGLIPKIGCPEAAALDKLRSNKTIVAHTSRFGKYKVYWVRVPGYFCQFMLDPPMARPENGGMPRMRGEVNSLSFDSVKKQRAVHAILNSSTYYQFYTMYSDARHINPSDVKDFPLNLDAFNDYTIMQLERLSVKLQECYHIHTHLVRKNGLLIDSIDSKACKAIIDEIDWVLAKHYRFTDTEADFIINYDVKYRMMIGKFNGV